MNTYSNNTFTRTKRPSPASAPAVTDVTTHISLPQDGPYRMRDYLFGWPELVYLLSTGEVCQTQLAAGDNRHGWFVKNGNSEELAEHSGFIWRGTDTSPNEAEYYQLWEGGSLGSKWCPALWSIGQPFRRAPEVRYFRKSDGQPSRDTYTDVSYLELVAHHHSRTFPSGLTVVNVLELAWYYTPNQKVERYWYAKGIGLVGFSSGEVFHSYIVSLDAPSAPVRKSWPGIMPMTLPAIPRNQPPTLPAKDSNVWKDAQLLVDKCRIRDAPFVERREFPEADSTIVREPGKVLVTVGIHSNLKVWLEPNYEEDGYRWYGAQYGGHIGWMALVRDTLEEQFALQAETPAPEPDPTPPDAPHFDEANIRLIIELKQTKGRAYALMMEGFHLLAEAEQAEANLYKSLLPEEEEYDPLFSGV